MDQQQYCLKWNHHQSNLLNVFSRLLGSEQFTDVLLATEGKTIRCHKVVLSACSSYFENLFMTFDEKNQIIILKDSLYDDVYALVEFMYRGEINVGQGQLASLLKTAENLKIKGLAEVSQPDQQQLSSNGASLIPTSNVTNATTSTPPSSSALSMISSAAAPGSLMPMSPKKIKLEAPTEQPLMLKRKRGRPRILDAPGEINPFAQTRIPDQPREQREPLSLIANSSSSSSLQQKASSSHDLVTSTNKIDQHDDNSNEPTPGGPLTMERIKELGIVKMNDYLATGTRQQFWEEYYVKVVMQAVRNKEIDMKTGAEILGVSYGTLYGRYRETFGYLKHAWNSGGGRPPRPNTGLYNSPSMVPSSSVLDAGSLHILEQLKYGKINIRQAAELLKVEPTILAYELAAKANAMAHGDPENDQPDMDDEEDDYHDHQMMEVQPDVVIHDDLNDDDDDDDDDSRQHHHHQVQRHHHGHHHGSPNDDQVDPIATN